MSVIQSHLRTQLPCFHCEMNFFTAGYRRHYRLWRKANKKMDFYDIFMEYVPGVISQ